MRSLFYVSNSCFIFILIGLVWAQPLMNLMIQTVWYRPICPSVVVVIKAFGPKAKVLIEVKSAISKNKGVNLIDVFLRT